MTQWTCWTPGCPAFKTSAHERETASRAAATKMRPPAERHGEHSGGPLESSRTTVRNRRLVEMAASLASGTGSDRQRELLALCAIKGIDWHFIAREALARGAVTHLLEGHPTERSTAATRARKLVQSTRDSFPERLSRADDEIERAQRAGAKLITVLDEQYPANLKLVFNLPPFLFVRGSLCPADARSVAVVGTRKPSAEGLSRAEKMAAMLTAEGVTVVSGLANGIDTAAHKASLEAGGRTVAVVGTGIARTYPRQNEALADEIAATGAVVSQFWPGSPPARHNFPMRNVTMSGFCQGTVVIEASSTSGAKMQARLALEHGKFAFLLRSLVTRQSWAETYCKRHPRKAIEVSELADVLRHIRSPQRIAAVTEQHRQLALSLPS